MNQVVSTTGDVYDPSWPKVVSGHIHESQTVGGNIIYVGTPWSTIFTSSNRNTVSLLDFDTSKETKASFTTDLHELKGIPSSHAKRKSW